MGIHGSNRINYGSSISPRYEPRSRTEYAMEEARTKMKDPNPDPYNFRVLFEKKIGNYLAAMILYPDATNYEGVKVLVLKDTVTLKDLKVLDPHFLVGSNLIARFVPDEAGWELALQFANSLDDKTKGVSYYKD